MQFFLPPGIYPFRGGLCRWHGQRLGLPRKMGANGGGAFLVAYPIFVALFSVVGLSAEYAIGYAVIIAYVLCAMILCFVALFMKAAF